jgi:hypothetical protein
MKDYAKGDYITKVNDSMRYAKENKEKLLTAVVLFGLGLFGYSLLYIGGWLLVVLGY